MYDRSGVALVLSCFHSSNPQKTPWDGIIIISDAERSKLRHRAVSRAPESHS